jgi:hypothetical protein
MENYRNFFVREAERITGCDMKSLGNTLPGHGSPVLWKSPEGRWMRHPGMRTVQGM